MFQCCRFFEHYGYSVWGSLYSETGICGGWGRNACALEGNCGKILGTVLDIHGVPVSVMALSNATVGGIGPNEDIEGNVNLYGKKDLSEKLHLDRIPSFVIEIGRAHV